MATKDERGVVAEWIILPLENLKTATANNKSLITVLTKPI